MVFEHLYLHLARISVAIAVHLVEWSRRVVNSYYDMQFNLASSTSKKSKQDLNSLEHEYWRMNRALEM